MSLPDKPGSKLQSAGRVVQATMELSLYRLFHSYGRFVASNALPVLMFGLVLSIGCSTGLVFFRFVDNPNAEYTPSSAPSRYEQDVMSELRQRQADSDKADEGTDSTAMLYRAFQIQITAVDDGDLLNRTKCIKSLDAFIKFVKNDFREFYSGFTYLKMCGKICDSSQALESFIQIFKNEQARKDVNIQLTFPVISALGKRVFIGSQIFGVSTQDREITGAKLAIFQAGSAVREKNTSRAFDRWKNQLQHFVFGVDMRRQFPLLNAALVDGQIMNEEVTRTGIVAVPYLLVTVAVLLVFSVLTSVKSDTTRSKPWLAILACILPILGTLAAFGLLALIGLPFQTICVISMFLALGIGVDDAYLMLHSWHHSLGSEHRLATCVAVSGPSITITSLTNLISFLVGISSDTPAIRVFCIYTSVTLLFCFILQLTLFTAALALDATREHRRMNALFICVKMSDAEDTSGLLHSMITTVTGAYDRFLVFLSRVYVSWWSAVVLAVCLVVYWSVSAWAIANVRVHVSLDVLILPDSVLWDFFQWDKKYTSVGVQQVEIVVSQPGDFRNQTRLSEMFTAIKKFEQWDTELMLGSDTTMFWLKNYVNYLSLFGAVQFKYTDLPDFLTLPSYSWNKFSLDYNESACLLNEPSCVRSFVLSTAINKPTEWSGTIELIAKLRALAAEQSQFNMSIQYTQAFLADQVETLWPTTLRTVLFTLIAMSLVCVLFVPEPVCVVCAMLAVLSINIGVFGLGALWDVHLDMITAVGLLMSIGISVDFTAHVTYHYFKAVAKTEQERVLHALRGCAWPMLQAAVSSGLCALVMAQLGASLIIVFMKIILLVVFLGVAHGLVVLPIVMSRLPFSKQSNTSVSLTDSKTDNDNDNNSSGTDIERHITADTDISDKIEAISMRNEELVAART